MVSSCSNGGVNNINRERDGVSLSLFPPEVFPLSANVRRAHASRQNQEHSFDTIESCPRKTASFVPTLFPRHVLSWPSRFNIMMLPGDIKAQPQNAILSLNAELLLNPTLL